MGASAIGRRGQFPYAYIRSKLAVLPEEQAGQVSVLINFLRTRLKCSLHKRINIHISCDGNLNVSTDIAPYQFKKALNGRESTVNRALDGSIYPG
jgi:hypothetical protein